ncbi:MAG: hypothetical protein FJ038_02455 [Chloroflexi bacterium]|nr:hypothetical protein [Chloroflexota bacterium]
MDAATWISLGQLTISIVGIAITAWLAVIVQRSATRIAQLEFNRALRDSWMHVDEMVLQKPEFLELVDRYLEPRETADPTFAQKRHFLFVFLSPLYTTYQAARQGLASGGSAETIATVKAQLARVLLDEDAFWLTQNQGYDSDFMTLCRDVHDSLSHVVSPPTRATNDP